MLAEPRPAALIDSGEMGTGPHQLRASLGVSGTEAPTRTLAFALLRIFHSCSPGEIKAAAGCFSHQAKGMVRINLDFSCGPSTLLSSFPESNQTGSYLGYSCEVLAFI